MNQIRCNFCGSACRPEYLESEDDYTRKVFSIVTCVSCGIGQTLVPEDFDVSKYYPTSYYGAPGYRYHQYVECLVGLSRILRAKKIQRVCSTNNNRILDIGCGRGLVLRLLANAGWNVYGTERSRELVNSLTDSGVHAYLTENLSDCRFNASYFTVVTLWHVLEHMENPAELLDEIVRILVPGGLLIIEVPNFESYQSKMSPQDWLYLEVPRHLYHFSVLGLRREIVSRGFDVSSLQTLSIEYGVIGFVTSCQNWLTTQKNFLYSILYTGGRFCQPEESIAARVYNILVIVITTPIVTPLGFIFEIFASFFRKGSIIRIVARSASTRP